MSDNQMLIQQMDSSFIIGLLVFMLVVFALRSSPTIIKKLNQKLKEWQE